MARQFRSQLPLVIRLAITFGGHVTIMGVITLTVPLRKPAVLPVQEHYNTTPSRSVVWPGTTIVLTVVALDWLL